MLLKLGGLIVKWAHTFKAIPNHGKKLIFLDAIASLEMGYESNWLRDTKPIFRL